MGVLVAAPIKTGAVEFDIRPPIYEIIYAMKK
jgi:hypothetical protein